MLEKIEKHLASKGIRQGELAAMVGVLPARISKWKSGEGEPTARQALRIARALDLPLEYLVDDDADELPEAKDSTEETQILDLYRALGLTKDEALRAFALAGHLRESTVGNGSIRVGVDRAPVPVEVPRERKA